jgi:uncharacterized hydrophobic protein (TIGR00271 family)
MPQVTPVDVDRMRDAVFFDGPDVGRQLSRFWILLILASIIASAGVVADSTATVIGAMIVAPLMTPILGTMLAVVLGDRNNLLRSLGLVVAGAFAAILIGFAVGLLVPSDVLAATNGQVAGRIHPRLVDLLAAVATGAVGSIVLARPDISDTLPGVAIAISLVPPLTVVGLTAEAGAWEQSAGALLLFSTNVAAILATGIVVMAIYGVHRFAETHSTPARRKVNRRNAVLVIVGFFVLIGIPLTITSVRIARDTAEDGRARRAAVGWAEPLGWKVLDVNRTRGSLVLRFAGPPPIPGTTGLAEALEAEGIEASTVTIDLVPQFTVSLADDGS